MAKQKPYSQDSEVNAIRELLEIVASPVTDTGSGWYTLEEPAHTTDKIAVIYLHKKSAAAHSLDSIIETLGIYPEDTHQTAESSYRTVTLSIPDFDKLKQYIKEREMLLPSVLDVEPDYPKHQIEQRARDAVANMLNNNDSQIAWHINEPNRGDLIRLCFFRDDFGEKAFEIAGNILSAMKLTRVFDGDDNKRYHNSFWIDKTNDDTDDIIMKRSDFEAFKTAWLERGRGK